MKPLDHVLVPIASQEDAVATCAALDRFLDSIERVTAVHVIEKADGAPDKAPLAKRREDAAEFLATVDSRLGDVVAVDIRIVYGTDVVDRLFEEAEATGVTALAFRPRSGSRFVRLLTGDTATRLVTESELPVVSLPDSEED